MEKTETQPSQAAQPFDFESKGHANSIGLTIGTQLDSCILMRLGATPVFFHGSPDEIAAFGQKIIDKANILRHEQVSAPATANSGEGVVAGGPEENGEKCQEQQSI